MNTNTEAITKATQTSNLLRADLLDALKTASPVEALILIPMIAKVASLETELRMFHSAIKENDP